MPAQDIEERFHQVIANASLCTLATASPDGVPEAAEMSCAEAPGWGLYLYTLNDSRKYHNLSLNPRAAMVIFQPPEYVQLDGAMEELAGGAALDAREAMMARAEGDLAGYHHDPRCRYFLFRPQRVCLRIDQSYPSKYETWDLQKGTTPHLREL